MTCQKIQLDYFIQYEKAVKLRGFISDLQFLGNQYNMCDLDPVFDLDNAIGYQLDYIGKLVGLERPINFINNSMLWRRGFWRVNNWGGSGSSIPVFLDDTSYIKLLKAYCSQLVQPVTLNNIYKVLIDGFGDYPFEVIAGGLEILIRIPPAVPDNDKTIIVSGIIIPPQGVNIIYEIIP